MREVLEGSKELKPSAKEVTLLTAKQLGLAQLSNEEWLEAIRDEADPHRPFAPLLQTRSAEKMWADQQKRARKVAGIMIEKRLKKILLMDGHGRFVFALLDALLSYEQDLAAYTISLVDLDPNVADWHEEFIPGTHVYGDILGLEVEDDTFYYLNFCSLGDQKRRVLEFMERAPKPLMISFFRRNPIGKIEIKGEKLEPPRGALRNKDRSLSFAGMITELNERFDYAVVSSRGLFVTLVCKATFNF